MSNFLRKLLPNRKVRITYFPSSFTVSNSNAYTYTPTPMRVFALQPVDSVTFITNASVTLQELGRCSNGEIEKSFRL